MDIVTLTVSLFATNCYLVYDRDAGDGVIIDPGDETDRIVAEIEQCGFRPHSILLTHGHGDHIGAVQEIKDKYRIPFVAGRGAERVIKSSNKNFFAMFGMPVSCPMPDRLLADGETVPVGKASLAVIETPGHSPDGICFLWGDVLFCGDTLFYGSVGRTDLPGADHDQLINSITQRLLVLPDTTICHPGHGPSTTIGQEREHNPFLIGSYLD